MLMSKRTNKPLLTCGLLVSGGLLVLLTVKGLDMAGVITLRPEPVLPDGILARSDESPRVYVIENREKRWVPSLEIFNAQGFDWGEVRAVTEDDLSTHDEGAPVDLYTDIVLAGEESVLPDLIPLAGRDLFLSRENGRLLLRFTTMFWNAGDAAHELIAYPEKDLNAEDGYLDTYQHIVRADGTTRDRLSGVFLWHALHNHYHYDQFADYVLTFVRPTVANTVPPPTTTHKTTFCMRDDAAIDLTLPNASAAKRFSVCGKYRQGVSVGWADRYGSELPDQYIDVNDLPAGIYALSFVVDPNGRFLETSDGNNTSVTLLELDPANATMSVIAKAAPFETSDNDFPDGMLIRSEGDSKVYVTQNDQKRWLRGEEVFLAYGYAWSDIYVLPAGTTDAIPDTDVLRAPDGSLHAINDAGYRRQILNLDVFASYGWSDDDVASVNATELASYPQTDYIMREGDTGVFSIRTKRYVGTLDSLGAAEAASVHVVNQTDFNAYGITVVATGLSVPWDIVFLPDGDMLVTERPGTLRRIGARNASIDIPDVKHSGEGGLMGIALHPQFAANQYVYLYFTTTDGNQNRVQRFRLEGDALVEDKIIIDGIPAELYHDGGQIAFGPDGYLYVTTGDASDADQAQDLGSLAGKTLRLTSDGAIPSDNPFGTAVWSYGHRNAQGLAWDASGRLWETEHGRSGALSGYDEVNRVEKGKNYGWPTIQGDQSRDGMVTPAVNSGATTTWAPSGIAYADGSLFFAGLRGSALYEVTFGPNGTVAGVTPHLEGQYGRLRAVVLGPDGYLYVTTSNLDGRGTPRPGDDQILKIHPDFFK